MAGQRVVKTFLKVVLLDEASKSALVVLFLVHGGKKYPSRDSNTLLRYSGVKQTYVKL